MKKTALITGILGQDGAYLAQFLLSKEYKIFGMIRRHPFQNFVNTDYLGVTKEIEFISGDMTDEASLMNIVRAVRPDEVYNLAAQSLVEDSWEQARLTTEVNALGVLYLLNAIKFFHPVAKFYQASTSEMFGNSSGMNAANEHTPFYPRSPYGISKLYAHWMTINFRESYGMFCASGILFNHESPLRGEEFVTRKIAKGAAEVKHGLQNAISLGNLESKRDWGFAGDFVEAMWLMLQQEKAKDYVIATGETHSVANFLESAFMYVGIKEWRNYVTVDPRFMRPAEVHYLRGDASYAKQKLGWQPKVDFQALVKLMVDAELERLEHV